ncbi:hypothetical protein SOVF_191180 [Spinacia oleracea]|nr:hypothetical protein SOVF_191180 [Spinacia oleracea]
MLEDAKKKLHSRKRRQPKTLKNGDDREPVGVDLRLNEAIIEKLNHQ